MDERVVTGEHHAEDSSIELSLRPTTLTQYIGQTKVKENLSIFILYSKM